MNKSRATSFLLALIITISCFIFSSPVTNAGENDIVTATAEDFFYYPIPEDKPTSIHIEQYLGEKTKIIIPDTIDGLPVTSFSDYLFAENEYIEYIRFPASTQRLSTDMFYLCSNLTVIEIDEGNLYYTTEDGVVYNKDKSTLLIYPCGKSGGFTIPDSVISIGKAAFDSCYNLTDIKMSNNLLSIGEQAFLCCWNLSSIRLSDNLESLGFRALAFCDSLTQIHLPGSLKNIGTQALIGGIDSNSNWYYNFIDGVYYVPGTASEKYVKSLHVAKKYTIAEPRRITNPQTNIAILDPNSALPKTGEIKLIAKLVDADLYSSLIPIRYANSYAYTLTITVDGKPFTPKKDIIVEFGKNEFDVITTATKVYQLEGNSIQEIIRQPHTPFVGLQTKALGTYVIVANNDFSLSGDIDGDGTVTIYDTRFALSIAAGLIQKSSLTPEQLEAANADKNTTDITTRDAVKILRFAAGIEK